MHKKAPFRFSPNNNNDDDDDDDDDEDDDDDKDDELRWSLGSDNKLLYVYLVIIVVVANIT